MKTAIVAAGAALAVQGAFAAGNDLFLSLNNNSGSGTTEFTVDLGSLSSFQSGTSQVDLSSFMSTFNTYASAGVPGLNVGVAGGLGGQGGVLNQGLGNLVYTTTLRSSNIGQPAVSGSSGPSVAASKATISSAAAVVGGTGMVTGPNVSTTDSSNGSFTANIAKVAGSDPTDFGTAGNNFSKDLGGANPLQGMTGSSIVLDLWKNTVTSAAGNGTVSGWIYEGNFTLDLSGAEPTLIFDAASAVPEPSTYGLFAGAGLLALSLRRQFRRKTA